MKTVFTAAGAAGLSKTGTLFTPQRYGDPRRNWQAISQLATAILGLQSGLRLQGDQFAVLKLIARRLVEFHPFKIYQLPDVLRGDDADPATDWRKFRVRAGRVILGDVHGVDVDGTDGADEDPDDETFPAMTDIEVPEDTEEFWFWIEIDPVTPAATLMYGDDPTANGWDGFPQVDSTHIPIGVVDVSTFADSREANIRQLLRTDVLNTPDNCPLG